MTLGQKIKKLRTEKGITQKDLADQVHVAFQTISKWENDENEPDVSTLRELAKLFGCSLDTLLSEDDIEQPKEKTEPVLAEELVNVPEPKPEPVTRTYIIHQKELHVCEHCKKDIPENELDMEQVCVSHRRRGHSAQYRTAYYHKRCLAEVKRQREISKQKARKAASSQASKKCFGWAIAGGVVALVAALLIMLFDQECKEVIQPGFAVLYSFIASYGIFAMLYCIISGSYIGDVFVWCAGLSIKFPGLIFSWDLDGFAWLIVMKILFAILGFLVGVFALLFAIVFSAVLGGISFPFVLIHNINTDYEDTL